MRSSIYNKLPPRHQDSLDDVPDLSNNNQDVSLPASNSNVDPTIFQTYFPVHCCLISRASFRHQRLEVNKI